MLRFARLADGPALTDLINRAYEVEQFFKPGPRTDEAEVKALIEAGTFLLMEEEGKLVGCAHVAISGDRGKLSFLAVEPEKKGHGLGKRLVAAAEDHCRQRGRQTLDLSVVNLRKELPPFYRALGYRETGMEPFPVPERATIACHLVVMSKDL